ncbi:hypothetical protein BH09BAC4_BH09BAC4_40560 [soil metagenome]
MSEVDNYIHTHQYLPGVPSAIEVVANGVDAAKMDAKLTYTRVTAVLLSNTNATGAGA